MNGERQKIIEQLRKAQRHLGHAEDRLANAGLGASKAPDELQKKIWAWVRTTRELQIALYQEAIKDLEATL